MTNKVPVLIKVLDAKSALDLGASFTGEVKKATQVRAQILAAFLKITRLT